MMRTGHVWVATCVHCGKASDPWGRLGGEVWQEDEPGEAPPHTGDCCDAVCLKGAAKMAKWELSIIKESPPLRGRRSAFSWSDADFNPHFNTAAGQHVESLDHMKRLQAEKGMEDVGVTGDAAEKYVPRDIGRKVKRYNDMRENWEKYEGVAEWDAEHS